MTNPSALYDVADPLVVVVSRAEVESMNPSVSLEILKRLIESPERARDFVERVDIVFHGYDDTREELFEIPEVREFVHQLDQQFPFWLFFLSKYHQGLQCLVHCFLPPFLKEEARSRIFPDRLGALLTNRWLPAMNHMCQFVGYTQQQIDRLTDRAVEYITAGRFPARVERFR